MDTYPRYDVFFATDPVPEGDIRIAHRVSQSRMEAMLYGVVRFFGLVSAREVIRARFSIKVARYATRDPIILTDASRPAFRGQYRTLDAACLAMDNIVRRERNMPSRIGGLREATERYLEAKAQVEAINERILAAGALHPDRESTPEKRLENLLEGRTPAVRPDAFLYESDRA